MYNVKNKRQSKTEVPTTQQGKNQCQSQNPQQSVAACAFHSQLSTLKKSQFSTLMATSSSCSSPYTNGSSPITTIAQDHLFSILLLLPLDSIFCFALTCKKFRSLTYSDSLWESLCRRDWGNSTIDALRSFAVDDKQQQFPWKKLYQQIYQLDSVYCRRLLTHPLGGEELILPRPRASHSLNFVSGSLVLFGGGCEGGQSLFHISST